MSVDVSGAKVVTNSHHNNEYNGVGSIKERLIEQGLKEEHFHEDHQTIYPNMRERDTAVREWLARHPEVSEWLAIDDTPFLDENLILVNSDAGITLNDMNMALMHFNCETVTVFI